MSSYYPLDRDTTTAVTTTATAASPAQSTQQVQQSQQQQRFLLPPVRADGTILRSWRAVAPPLEWRYTSAQHPNGLLEVRGEALKQERVENAFEAQRHIAEYLSSGNTVYSQADVSALEHGPVHSWVNLTLAMRLSVAYQLPLESVVYWHGKDETEETEETEETAITTVQENETSQ